MHSQEKSQQGKSNVTSQYWVASPLLLITAWILLGMDDIISSSSSGASDSHTWWSVAFSSSMACGWASWTRFFTSCHTNSIMFKSGELDGRSRTGMLCCWRKPWVFFALWAGARSCWKNNSSSSLERESPRINQMTVQDVHADSCINYCSRCDETQVPTSYTYTSPDKLRSWMLLLWLARTCEPWPPSPKINLLSSESTSFLPYSSAHARSTVRPALLMKETG